MHVSQFFRLNKSQAQLDFVDVDVSRDTRLFIDPYAIEIRDDPLSEEFKHHITSYFAVLVEAIRSGAGTLTSDLTAHLSEPHDTFLGMSKGKPSGRGIGPKQARQIVAALRRSRSVKTGQLADLGETELFIEGISSDKLSDLTTNLIRWPLVRYTQRQCELNGIPLEDEVAIAPSWNPSSSRWEAGYASLPIVSGVPVLLVPKVIVRRILTLNSQEFYNHHMINFLKQEELRTAGSLVRVLKNKKQVVDVGRLKKRHPFEKLELEAFAQNHPEILERYKNIKGATGALPFKGFDEEFSETAFARALQDELRTIPTGSETASRYHSFMVGALTFLMYPWLADPLKEAEINDGRKRIDIRFTNAAREGFFERMRALPAIASSYVPVECKNYSKDLKNPELDQMTGRFATNRGQVGLLCCRSFEDKALFETRCRDTALEGRGFIIVLDDDDIHQFLECVHLLNRQGISKLLESKYSKLVS
ncbi:hypothetical protein [uncultured Brevundimonas sp.]|uniref:hypothetical protein n=1 Tax=uncultured Brevundimonas sp. TaxID=213418 RepID=UPI0026284DBB|nr:hypothetical protein [uncultured Brevundimonas sp.]